VSNKIIGKHVVVLIACLAAFTCNTVTAQTSSTKEDVVEDTTVGIKPTLKVENLSAAGHCDNQQLTFFAPWADHYEIAKRRSDTSWIKEAKPVNTWFTQTLKPGVNGMIYKRLDEQGTYQFVVKAFKGNRYRKSDTITLKACIGAQQ